MVAATAVLGAAADGLGWVALASGLLAAALVLFILVSVPVLCQWQTPTRGVSVLLAVALASISVVAVELSAADKVSWLLTAAEVCCGLALVAYLFLLRRFDFRELLRGRVDQWVAGGALAIATLAGGEICLRLRASGHPFNVRLAAVVTVLWVAPPPGSLFSWSAR